MIRPWQVWLAFALGAAVVLGATGWASWTALRLDRAKAEALRKSAIEENVRLALWRMDSSLAGLIGQENSRPYFLYTSFYPAERAYTRMYNKLEPNEVLVPSPLLTFESPEVKLHFQIAPLNLPGNGGEFSSPQVPTGNMRDLAEMGYRESERIEKSAALLADMKARIKPAVLMAELFRLSPKLAVPSRSSTIPPNPAQKAGERYRPTSQAALSLNEQQSRQQTFQQELAVENTAAQGSPQPAGVGVGLMMPLWLDGELILARTVRTSTQNCIQSCWLDWPRIQENLLAGIRDLAPEARLEPVTGKPSAADTRVLAALPVRLLPGALPAEESHRITPVQLSLLVGWGALLLAALGVGLVLRQALLLSERRAVFVSAVTHELRTPLTTFRLYTELLSEGDRISPEKRATYLTTLRREADRLGHLVENVLAYARLERKGLSERAENIALGTLLERSRARLADRAAQAGMSFVTDLPEDAAGAAVRADPSAVEQILFNLVDNACKYAAAATDKTIRLDGALDGARVTISVRDFGPGLRDTRRLFQPFSKPAQEAACTAPGVGLGLALSRRLARGMGGDLACDVQVSGGARFVLTLPRAYRAPLLS